MENVGDLGGHKARLDNGHYVVPAEYSVLSPGLRKCDQL